MLSAEWPAVYVRSLAGVLKLQSKTHSKATALSSQQYTLDFSAGTKEFLLHDVVLHLINLTAHMKPKSQRASAQNIKATKV